MLGTGKETGTTTESTETKAGSSAIPVESQEANFILTLQNKTTNRVSEVLPQFPRGVCSLIAEYARDPNWARFSTPNFTIHFVTQSEGVGISLCHAEKKSRLLS